MKQKFYTPEAVEKTLPEKLKTFRKQVNLTTSEVGKILNKTPSAITLWETGKALPDVNTLLKLCNIYKVSDLNEFLDPHTAPETKTLARSEQELLKLYRLAPQKIKTAIKTILEEFKK